MAYLLPVTGRIITGLMILCVVLPGNAQTDEDAQTAEAPEQRLSVYETLVFDNPVAIPAGEVLADFEKTAMGNESGILEAPMGELDPSQVLDLQRFQETISAIEYEGGAWDINLTENLTSMGEIYQRQGMHEEAIDSFSRAMHVSRVNYGLNSLDHIPFVERMVDSYLALGDWDSADQYQQYLYYTQSREFGMNDPRMVPVLYKRANWELNAFNARIGDEVGAKLLRALYLFQVASSLVSVHFGPDDERYSRYLRDTAGTAYLVSRYRRLIRETTEYQYSASQDFYLDTPRSPGAGYQNGYEDGLEALQRIAESFAEDDRNSVEYAQALILEGDWYLLFERRRAAQAKYRAAFDILGGLPDGETLIQQTFGTVQALPDFSDQIESIFVTGNFEGRASVARERGYVDVQIDVTAYGTVANLEVLTDESEVDSRVLSSLRRRIRGTVFRPIVRDGEVVRSNGNRLRYHYVY